MYSFEELLVYVVLAFLIGYAVREVLDIIAINEYLMKGGKRNGNFKSKS